ncbi:YsnF/AvaK domain-containing protein [Bacillus songklensis]|uniref:YsnF/AvaK domain-containing protein n=1 Tax=Bacillus songklensis TaxID=1069116 RepID=A0ABV8B2W8_9BACI
MVGTFYSEQEVLYAIEGLKRKGYRETDIMVVAKNRSDIPLVAAQTGVMIEADMQVSTLAGAMMGSLFTMMTAGMGGLHANALADRLMERGIPEFTAKQCETEVNKGKMIVLVDMNPAYSSPIYDDAGDVQVEAEEQKSVRLREEQLDVTRERVQIGELQLRKEVIEEQRTIHVPLTREEVYVERRPVVDGKYDGGPISDDELIHIPIMEERIEVTKRPVVVEEIIVGKRKIQETKQVQDIVKKEEARIERTEAPVMEENPYITHLASEEDLNIASLTNNGKEEIRTKRTGSLAVKEDKENPGSPNNQKNETSVNQKDSSDVEANKNIAISANSKKEGATLKAADSSDDEENKNNKTQINKKKK